MDRPEITSRDDRPPIVNLLRTDAHLLRTETQDQSQKPGETNHHNLTRIASQGDRVPSNNPREKISDKTDGIPGHETPDRFKDAGSEGDKPYPPQIHIVEIKEIGTFSLPPGATTRDGGATAIVVDRTTRENLLVGFFGDTLQLTPELEELQGHPYTCICNTAGVAKLSQPLEMKTPLDEKGLPLQFVKYTEAEQRVEDERMRPILQPDTAEKSDRPGETLMGRVVIWPGSLISDGEGGAIAFCHKLTDEPGFNYTFQGVVAARVEVDKGQPQAMRLPGLLFEPSEPSFTNAMVDNKMVYLYGQDNGSGEQLAPTVLARVPLKQATEHSAYEFWDGQSWTKDVTRIAPVMEQIPDAMTVSYNPHLNCYTAIHSRPLSSEVMLRTAESPEGPWSEPKVLFTGKPPSPPENVNGPNFNYAAIAHPDLLAKDNGRKIAISYFMTQMVSCGL